MFFLLGTLFQDFTMRFQFICAAVVALGVCGCGNENAEIQSGKVVSWPELDRLQSDDGMMGAGRSIEMGDAKGAAKHITAPGFKTLLDDFEKSSAPSGTAGEDGKKAAVDAVNGLISAAGGSPKKEELKAAYDKAAAALSSLTKSK